MLLRIAIFNIGLVILLMPTLAGCLSEPEKSNSEPIPMAMPHEGDKGHYTLLKAPLSEEARGQSFSKDRLLNISFLVEDSSVFHDRNGKAYAAWDLLVSTTDEQTSPYVFLGNRFHISPSTFEVLGTSSIHKHLSEPHESKLFPYTWRQEGVDTSTTLRFRSSANLPCGLLEFQPGGNFPASGDLAPSTMECSWEGMKRWTPKSHQISIQERSKDHPPWIVVDHHVKYYGDEPDLPGPEWRAWYVENIPYPVRVQDLVGGNFGAPGDELVLIDFERGKNPPASIPHDALRDLPPVVEAPLTPWTIPDLETQHPWPLREAYAYARDDPDPLASGFREFLEQHPDAYLAEANHFASDDGDKHSEHWMFIVAEKDEHFSVSIVQDQTLDSGLVTYRYDGYGVQDNLRDTTWPAKNLLPHQLLTPQSLLAQWEIAMGETASPSASPSYSISINCRDECQGAIVVQAVGAVYRHHESEGVHSINRANHDTMDSSQLHLYDGAIFMASVARRTHNSTTEVTVGPEPFPPPGAG